MMSMAALFRRVMAERRSIIVPLALIALVNVGLYVLLVYPLTLKVRASERRVVAARAQVAGAEKDDRDVRSTLALTQQADRDLDRFYRDVLPADLTAARHQTYEHLAALAHEHNLIMERRSYDVDSNYKGRLERLDIGMVLTGDYGDVRDFIYALESSPEFVTIEDIALASGAQQDTGLTLNIRLSTYYRGPNHGV
jgi:type IV pilus assembly protein PilO